MSQPKKLQNLTNLQDRTVRSSLAGTCAGRVKPWQVEDCAPRTPARPLYAVDGWFLTQRVSGIQRYAIEILAELDRQIPAGSVEIVLPEGAPQPVYDNIRVVVQGQANPLWEQRDYPRYLAGAGRRWLCMCNVIPLHSPDACRGIAVWHDVCYRARPDFYRDPRGLASAAWHRLRIHDRRQGRDPGSGRREFRRRHDRRHGLAP